jgi:hypothetical protein
VQRTNNKSVRECALVILLRQVAALAEKRSLDGTKMLAEVNKEMNNQISTIWSRTFPVE